jgi:hypothetical protein
MRGAGNPLNYDYRDPRHVERYNKLVIRHPTGETEGKHPRDADADVMREIHEPAPLLRVIRAKCIDCSGGSESEARKCTAIRCALWPNRMATNPFRTPRELTPERREELVARGKRLARSAPAWGWNFRCRRWNFSRRKRGGGSGRRTDRCCPASIEIRWTRKIWSCAFVSVATSASRPDWHVLRHNPFIDVEEVVASSHPMHAICEIVIVSTAKCAPVYRAPA